MFAFLNNCEGVLAEAVEPGDVKLTLADAGKWGDVTFGPGVVIRATITHPSDPGSYEVVAILGKDEDALDPDVTFRIERGLEDGASSGASWPAGAKVSARITAEMLEAFPQLHERRFLMAQAAGGPNYFSLGSFAALSPDRAKPTDGHFYGSQDKNFGVEIAGCSQPVSLSQAPAWQTSASYNAGAVVSPPVADGFQYWFDPLYEGATAQTATAPEFAGDSEPTVAYNDGLPGQPVGFWVPTPQPVDTEIFFGAGARLVLSEAGFIASLKEVGATAPVVSIGDGSDMERFADNVALSQIAGNGHIHRITIADGGALPDRLNLRLDTPATGGQFRGRFYWRGFFFGDA